MKIGRLFVDAEEGARLGKCVSVHPDKRDRSKLQYAYFRAPYPNLGPMPVVWVFPRPNNSKFYTLGWLDLTGAEKIGEWGDKSVEGFIPVNTFIRNESGWWLKAAVLLAEKFGKKLINSEAARLSIEHPETWRGLCDTRKGNDWKRDLLICMLWPHWEAKGLSRNERWAECEALGIKAAGAGADIAAKMLATRAARLRRWAEKEN